MQYTQVELSETGAYESTQQIQKQNPLVIITPNPQYQYEKYIGLQLFQAYIFKDIKLHSSSFKIGIYTIFLVVSFLTILLNVTWITTPIFLKLAEEQTGDADILIIPKFTFTNPEYYKSFQGFDHLSSSLQLLNYHKINLLLKNSSELKGISPRWLYLAQLENPINPHNPIIISNRSFLISGIIQKEEEIGLGKGLSLLPLAKDECYVFRAPLQYYGYPEDVRNSKIKIKTNFLKTLLQFNVIFDADTSGTKEQSLSIEPDFIKTLIHKELLNISQNVFIMQNERIVGIKNETFLVDLLNKFENASIYTNLIQQNMNFRIFYQSLRPQILNEFTQIGHDIYQQQIQNKSKLNVSLEEVGNVILDKLINIFNVEKTYKIKDYYTSLGGRFSDQFGEIVYIEQSSFGKTFKNQIINNIQQTINELQQYITELPQLNSFIINNFLNVFNRQIQKQIKQINMTNNALIINGVLNDRINIYNNIDYLKTKLIQLSNTIQIKLGRNPNIEIQAPISQSFTVFSIFTIFMDDIVFAIFVLLLIMSCLLIYSLMLNNVDFKTKEYGMLRALGLRTKDIVIILFLYAKTFAIPGLIIGLIIAYVISACIFYNIYKFFGENGSYQIQPNALIGSLILGIIVPIIANIIPVRKALSKTLRDSFEYFRSNVDQIQIKITQLHTLGLYPSESAAAILFIVIGQITYYFCPYSFVFMKLGLFLLIINSILVLLVLGLTFILGLFSGLYQKYLFLLVNKLFKIGNKIEKIILKNIEINSQKNSKPGLVFSLAVSFLIIGGTFFSSQSHLIKSAIKQNIGSDINVFSFSQKGLPEQQLRNYIENYILNNPNQIIGYTFIGQSFTYNLKLNKPTFISPLSNFPKMATRIVSVERNYFDSVYKEFYMPKDFGPYQQLINKLPPNQQNGIELLYRDLQQTQQQQQNNIPLEETYSNNEQRLIKFNHDELKDLEIKIIISSGAENFISLKAGSSCLLELPDTRKIKCKVVHTANKIPGFGFSGYPQIAFAHIALISEEDFLKIKKFIIQTDYRYNQTSEEYKNIPKLRLMIKFNDTTTNQEIEAFEHGLVSISNQENSIEANIRGILDDFDTSLLYFDLFFSLVIFISMNLSFFLLLINQTKIINESQKEIGILRAIGLREQQILYCYLIESILLVVTSGTQGLLIGSSIAYTISLQFSLFAELPPYYTIPTTPLVIMLTLSLLISVVTPYFTVKNVNGLKISKLLKQL